MIEILETDHVASISEIQLDNHAVVYLPCFSSNFARDECDEQHAGGAKACSVYNPLQDKCICPWDSFSDLDDLVWRIHT